MANISENENNSYERYVDLMYKSMDPEIDPFKDFLGYARGKFQKDNYDVAKGDYLPVTNGDCFDNIILNETITYPSLVKARNYRKSHVKEFKNLLRNKQLNEYCGTFPAFDENWKSENFDWIKASAILSAMHFRITISYGVEYFDDHKSVVLSVIGPDETALTEEVFEEFDIGEDKISEIMNDVKLVTEKFEKITPKNGYPNFERTKMTYGDLKKEKFNYEKFLEILLNEPLKDDDIIHLNNLEPGYFPKFLNIFHEVGPRIMANYITYKVMFQFENEYYSSAVTLYHFRPAVLAAGFLTFWNEDITQKRKQVFERFTKSLEKIKDNFKKDITEHLKSFTLNDQDVYSFIEKNYNQNEIDKEYENLEIDPDNFFQNFFNTRKHGITPSTKKYILMEKNERKQSLALRLLNFLIHHHNRPMFFYFSGWELEMWKDLIFDCRFDENSEEYKSLEKTVNDQIKKYNLSEGIVHNEFWVKINISTMAALKLAYKDYKIWLRENETAAKKEEEFLKKFNLTCTQAFFISFVQHHCWEKGGVILNSVFLSLWNCEEFAQAFGCKPESPMNPKDKCVLIWK